MDRKVRCARRREGAVERHSGAMGCSRERVLSASVPVAPGTLHFWRWSTRASRGWTYSPGMRLPKEENSQPNIRSISTTSRWILTYDPTAPAGDRLPAKPSARSRRRRRDARPSVQVTITMTGGTSEPYFVLRQNGRSWRYSGHDCLYDVVMHWHRCVMSMEPRR